MMCSSACRGAVVYRLDFGTVSGREKSDVMVQQGLLVRGLVPPAASSAAERPLRRTSARKPGAPRHALSVGLLAPRNRSRPRPAEQVRGAPRGRRDAGRHAVRHSGRQSDPRTDRRAGHGVAARSPGCRCRSRRRTRARSTTRSQRAPAATCAAPRPSSIRPRRCASRKRSTSRFPRLRFELRKTAKPGYLSLGIARILEVRDQQHPVRREIRAADADLLGASGDRRLDQPHRRLDRQQARGAVALCRRPDVGRRTAERRLFRAAAAQPADPGAEALPAVRPTCIRSGCTRSCCAWSASLPPSRPPERRAREYPAYDHDDLENVFAPVHPRPAGIPQRAARPPRDPARSHRARAERVRLADPRPLAVPQRDVRARGRGAPAADRNPEPVPAPVQGRARTPR